MIEGRLEARFYFYSFVVNLFLLFFIFIFLVNGLEKLSLCSFNPKIGQNMPRFGLLKFILLECSGCFPHASTGTFSAQEGIFLLSFGYFFLLLKLISPLRTPVICICSSLYTCHMYLIPIVLLSRILLLESRKTFQVHLL